MITYNGIISLFNSIATAHAQIHSFAHGELWELEGNIKPGIDYPLLYVVPGESTTTENTKQRKFRIMVCGQVHKDKSNETEVLSDCEQIIDDIIKIFRNESEAYELVGDPSAEPFKENFGDWLTGWHCELMIESDFNNNYCDVPASNLNSPVVVPGFAIIRNSETDEIVTTLKYGQTYYVTILETVEQSLATVTPTIIQALS